jgi:diguanylate cyclase (GGDEF)-like protein
MAAWTIIVAGCGYLGLLFAIAYYGERRAAAGHSIIANPYVYSLSLAVYATAWTFYGSVGRAADSGIGFLPIYLGPTIMITLWWVVLRKIIRVAKDNRITSLADFVSSRYGKSTALAGLVTVMAVVGVAPYISLQLKAISTSFLVLRAYPDIARVMPIPETIWQDTTLYVALILAAFTILFGTRHLDAAERHEGMVAAIAFESLIKLLAFVAVGIFVTYVMFNGFGDVFSQAAQVPAIAHAFTIGGGSVDVYKSWASLFSLAAISMLAIIFLPRQFQVAVIENVDESYLKKAIWVFPLYLLIFNIFVLPIAFGGRLLFGDVIDPDTFVLTLPLSRRQELLALLVFLGGLSAATGMVIVEAIALSTMVCNDLIMPALLRIKALALCERRDISRLLLGIRRATIVTLLLLGYAYCRLAGEAHALVATGLISFAAVAQFGPALLGGIYWTGGTRAGALAGLGAGFAVWGYTLLLPTFARSGWLPMDLVENGPFGLSVLRPLALFGLGGLDEITHTMLWSTLANAGAYLVVSVFTGRSALEQTQAVLFTDAFKHGRGGETDWRASGSLPELYALLRRFVGTDRAQAAFTSYGRERGIEWPRQVDVELVRHVESQLAGAIGAASARVMLSSVIKEELLRDSLTGLPNRLSLLDRLGEALKQVKRQPSQAFVLLLLRLDRFNVITDSLGGAAGDQLLIAVGRRLETSLRAGDIVAYLGSAEFAIILNDVREAGDAQDFAATLEAVLAPAFDLEGHEAFVTASIGMVLGNPLYSAPADILRDAETANHRAVTRGGACHELFAQDMRERVVALLEMETELRRAMAMGQEFKVHYQPVVSLRTGELTGFEALVRMRRLDGTLVPPSQFIPLTEETGMIVQIGRQVLAEACRQMRDWLDAYPSHAALQVSVNLAGRQFAEPDLVEQIQTVVTKTGLATTNLKLEVTETVLMEHAEAATAVLRRLCAMGIKLLIDDFGTGYSSLSYLHRFPIDTLKIDASFVRRMDADRKDAEIVRTIVALAHTLDMDIIAEGVETAAQLSRLQELGVEYGQGYYFAKPLPADRAEDLISSPRVWKGS